MNVKLSNVVKKSLNPEISGVVKTKNIDISGNCQVVSFFLAEKVFLLRAVLHYFLLTNFNAKRDFS